MAAFLMALVTVKNVNMAKIACSFLGRATKELNYKRSQRFLQFFVLPFAEIAQLKVKIQGLAGP
jgi:hypothetical protein